MKRKALRFELSGRFAHFAKPDTNKIAFTYSHVHKIALYGLMGAVMGFKGYQKIKFGKKQRKERTLFDFSSSPHPEFYERLSPAKIAIVPERTIFRRFITTYNNSMGFASSEQGGNLLVREQLLENPAWTIYVLDGFADFEKVAERFLKREATFSPYLGKNSYPANIENPSIVEISGIDEEAFVKCDSLVLEENIAEERSPGFSLTKREGRFVEFTPFALDEELYYVLKKIVKTDDEVRGKHFFYDEDRKKVLNFF